MCGNKRTRIIARITLTEPKTALAGVILEASLARFKASMVMFSDERMLSRRFGFAGVGSMGSESTWREETLQTVLPVGSVGCDSRNGRQSSSEVTQAAIHRQ